jgi:endonuclease/exonuclease/phosphatase family metal-dependent hydrolase
VGDFNAPLSPTDRSSKQKNQQRNSKTKLHHRSHEPRWVCRIFHPTSAQYPFFSAAHGTFSKIDHILGHKASLRKYKKIEIIPCILPDHNTLKLELNNKNSSKEHANNWKLNNTLINDQWVIDEKRGN